MNPAPRSELLGAVETGVQPRGVGYAGADAVAPEPLVSPAAVAVVCVVCEHGLEGLLGHVSDRLVRGVAACRVGFTGVGHARAHGAASFGHRASEPGFVRSLAQPLDASQRLELDVRRSVLDAGREVLGGILDLLPGQGLEHARELIEQVGCGRIGNGDGASGLRSGALGGMARVRPKVTTRAGLEILKGTRGRAGAAPGATEGSSVQTASSFLWRANESAAAEADFAADARRSIRRAQWSGAQWNFLRISATSALGAFQDLQI